MKTPILLDQKAEKFRQLGILHGYLRAHHAPDDVMEALCALTSSHDAPAAVGAKPVPAKVLLEEFEQLPRGEKQTDPVWENGFTKTAGSLVGGSGDPDADETQRVDLIAEGKKRTPWSALEKAKCWELFEGGMKPKKIAEKLDDEFHTGRDNIGVSAMLNNLKKEQEA